MKVRNIIFSLIILTLGTVSAIVFLYFIITLQLPDNNYIYKLLNIQKPLIVGFAPYWLIGKYEKDYTKYLNTFTYFGLQLNPDGTVRYQNNPGENEPGWNTLKRDDIVSILNNFKSKKLYTSLLIQSGDEDIISSLINNPKSSAVNFVDEVAPIIKQYGFTDLNLDIESFKEASASSQSAFTDFVKEVKSQLLPKTQVTLSVDISPSVFVKPFLINPYDIGQIADYVIIMGYDFQYSGSYLTGPGSPINGSPAVREYDLETTIKYALETIPKEKIILGFPLYGYEWETITNTPGAPVIPGSASTASSSRVEQLLKTCINCVRSFDQLSQSPYIIYPGVSNDYFHQIYYEDVRSFTKKLELVKKYKLRGVAVWALGYEDNNILKPLIDFKKYFPFVRLFK